MRRMRRALPLLALTGLLAGLLLLAPGSSSTWLHAYLVLVAAGVLAAAVRLLAAGRRATGPSVVDAALSRRAGRPARPEDLERLERLVEVGSASAFDLHYRLRPALRKVAEGILLGRGIELDAEPERARAALGEEAWSLLRPERPPPGDRRARGIAAPELDAVLRGIEGAR